MTIKRFFGGLLIAIGVLGMLFTGGCALTFLGESSNMLDLVLLLSGVPFIICLGMFFLGRFLYKNKVKERLDDEDETVDE
jgi:hypothetical protein